MTDYGISPNNGASNSSSIWEALKPPPEALEFFEPPPGVMDALTPSAQTLAKARAVVSEGIELGEAGLRAVQRSEVGAVVAESLGRPSGGSGLGAALGVLGLGVAVHYADEWIADQGRAWMDKHFPKQEGPQTFENSPAGILWKDLKEKVGAASFAPTAERPTEVGDVDKTDRTALIEKREELYKKRQPLDEAIGWINDQLHPQTPYPRDPYGDIFTAPARPSHASEVVPGDRNALIQSREALYREKAPIDEAIRSIDSTLHPLAEQNTLRAKTLEQQLEDAEADLQTIKNKYGDDPKGQASIADQRRYIDNIKAQIARRIPEAGDQPPKPTAPADGTSTPKPDRTKIDGLRKQIEQIVTDRPAGSSDKIEQLKHELDKAYKEAGIPNPQDDPRLPWNGGEFPQ